MKNFASVTREKIEKDMLSFEDFCTSKGIELPENADLNEETKEIFNDAYSKYCDYQEPFDNAFSEEMEKNYNL
jgi:hypothetical protein